MRTVLLLISLTLVGCGSGYNDKMIAQEFVPYVEKFIEAANAAQVTVSFDNVRIQFSEFGEAQNLLGGVCQRTRFDNVIINRDNWEKASELKRTVIIFHELGHCLLKRKHVDAVTPTGPVSLMHSAVAAYYMPEVEANFEAYAHELFHPAP